MHALENLESILPASQHSNASDEDAVFLCRGSSMRYIRINEEGLP